jgi:metallo-beta-lactamase family protein
MNISFLGGAGTVTGSKFLVTQGPTKVLIDCGLFQGLKQLRLRNWKKLPLQPGDLDAIALTHAHLDHSGYLPAVVRDGFAGPIYCTSPTADLADILLRDSGHLQEEDAAYANRKRFSKHKPALPLYTEEDGEVVSKQFRPIVFGEEIRVGELNLRFQSAGHILGASSVLVSHGGRSVLFSGDLGRPDDLLMNAPEPPPAADWIVCESTYGGRRHPDADPVETVGEIVRRTVERQGVLLVPSFAVGRAQTILYCLHRLRSQGAIPDVPIFVNSPMATNVTQLYQRYTAYHRLSESQCSDVCSSAAFIRTVEESKELNERQGPMVIISASGMITGGRILHHMKKFAPDAKNTILLAGFQAAGTRGEALARGARQIKIHGRYVEVNAEVTQLQGFSAHADGAEIVQWLGAAERPPSRIYLVHGEPSPADSLRLHIEETLRIDTEVAEQGETVCLE